MAPQSKKDAQQRVDQINVFHQELDLLETAQILVLTEAQHQALEQYHQGLVSGFSALFDVDTGTREKRFSLGMQITSFLGALALAASVFFLFYQFWGRFSTLIQVVILCVAPLLTLVGTALLARYEQSGYFAKLMGVLSLACFILNLTLLGRIFTITPSANALLVWATYAFLLAYALDGRLLLSGAILCLAGFLSAKAGTYGGCYWLYFGERPENFLAAGIAVFVLSLVPQRSYSGFGPIYRVFGLLLFFLPVLVLANWGEISYLPLPGPVVEPIYQLVGFIGSSLCIWLGVRRQWGEVVNTSTVLFTIFLYTKFFDWWWDWMPKYLFFLLVALSAILMLLIFKRLRTVAQHMGGKR